MEKLLKQAEAKAEYYKLIAEKTGKKRLREIDKLSKLIADLKKSEEKLQNSEKRYRAVVEDMPAMICRFLPDGTLTFANRAYCNYFNKTKE